MDQKPVSSVVAEIGGVYSELARQHGCDPKASGYHDPGARDIRYEKLAEIFALDDPPATFAVAELGCGYGAFCVYLDERLPGRILHYYGYDVSEEMLALARVHLNKRPATLVNSSSVDVAADYVFISGIFNVRLSATEADWRDYVKSTLAQSFRMAKRGVAFYTLTSFVDFRNEKFFYSNPEAMAEFCRRNLSPRVHVTQNYGLYEFTLCVLH